MGLLLIMSLSASQTVTVSLLLSCSETTQTWFPVVNSSQIHGKREGSNEIPDRDQLPALCWKSELSKTSWLRSPFCLRNWSVNYRRKKKPDYNRINQRFEWSRAAILELIRHPGQRIKGWNIAAASFGCLSAAASCFSCLFYSN